eukprot:scaffold194467_cov27-Tisochrysis_lutea.AAC.3
MHPLCSSWARQTCASSLCCVARAARSLNTCDVGWPDPRCTHHHRHTHRGQPNFSATGCLANNDPPSHLRPCL